jgi:cytochrome b6-f complex iron-sulfur subunit
VRATSLISCQNDSGVTPLAGDITLDLADSKYAALKSNNGYVVLSAQNVVVARRGIDTYVAVTLICSHEQKREITYKSGEFYCTVHGARFNNAGKGLNTDGKKKIFCRGVMKPTNGLIFDTQHFRMCKI